MTFVWKSLLVITAVALAAVVLYTSTASREPKPVSVKPPEQRTAMPLFTFASTSGARWSLEEHRGKIVLVNFWATWCGPCRKETPDLVRVYDRFRGRGVAFTGISMDQNAHSVVPRFVERYEIRYPILIPAPDSALANAIETIPTTFLIDRQGRVARTWVGALREHDLAGNIEQLLGEKPDSASPTESL